MAFDAAMLAGVVSQLRRCVLGARVEKVFQPEKDEIILQMRSAEGGRRLLLHAGSNNPRIGLTEEQRENPMKPPMLCMLLRKHLQGAKLTDVRQEGFERVATLEFEGRDEMGFACKRYLIAEIMGKYSNMIFANEEKRILAALHTVDFSSSSLRQVLPGLPYELPPKQEKYNPMEWDDEALFERLYRDANPERGAASWLTDCFMGISAVLAREIAFRAAGKNDARLGEVPCAALMASFRSMMESIRKEEFSPCMVLRDGVPVEYSFCTLRHYGSGFELRAYSDVSSLLDEFFRTRDREQHLRQLAADILRILSNADARLRKKLELQRAELADCAKGEEYKKKADLITANLYALERGMSRAELLDYGDLREDGTFGTCLIELDSRLSPSANAQRYYKRYNKSKNARVELTKQIRLGENELQYIDSVFDALSHAETNADLTEIRDELYRSGYASRMKEHVLSKKASVPTVAEFCTSGGYRVLCGKNNVQNEYITFKLAHKTDYWFHVKNLPGSHTVMLCNGEEPSETDFTEAAEIAAFFSKGADGQNVEVDYTYAKNVKKPAGGKPGLVIYHTNWSCVVTPNASAVHARRIK